MRTLGSTGLPVTPVGVGLAAVGRPAYITLGRGEDLGPNRGVDDLRWTPRGPTAGPRSSWPSGCSGAAWSRAR
jgi:hypothetical protein